MKQTLSPDIQEVINASHYRPAVSIIMPFEPKMNAKAAVLHSLHAAADKINREIRENYDDDLGELVMRKLKAILQDLNFSSFKKSIAIFVSPVFEKVLYLDIPVEERIVIDQSFEIRDLVFAKKEIHKYLVMVVSGNQCKTFIGNTTTFIKIKSDSADHVDALVNDAPERVANFSDPSQRKEITLKKFLRETDKGLSYLLKIYELPVFVVGPKKVTGYFKDITANSNKIAGYIHGNYEDATENELRILLRPHVQDWKKVRMEDLYREMEAAAGAGRLSSGMKEVWHKALHRKGRLLIVEKNFMYPAELGRLEDSIYSANESYNKFSYVKDAVDDAIEKVLEYGGDVEFVDEGMLSKYQHIVLIQYY